MAGELGSVSVSVRAETSQLEAGLSKARAETDKFDKAANKAATKGGKKLTAENKKAAEATNKLQGSLARASQSAAFLTGPLGGVASRINIVSSAMAAGALPILAWSAAVAGLVLVMRGAIREAEVMETAFLKTTAILKATGSSSGLTAKEIRALSREIGLATLASTAGVERAAQKLLTFRSIQGETFKEALRLSQDLAEVGFGSIESASTALGKALEDPINGITALRRVGVSFSEVQKEQIRNFVETGRVAEAQRVILDALQQQVGGAGAAAAGGLSGAYDTLSQRTSEFLENVGNNGPIQATTVIVNGLATAINALNEALFSTGESVDILGTLGKALSAFGPLGMLASNAFHLMGAAVSDTNDELRDNLLLEDEAQKRARAKAGLFAQNAESERKQAIALEASKKAQEAAAAAAKALADQRRQTIGALGDEVRVLGELSNLYIGTSMSAEQLATSGEILRTQTMLKVAANSAEGESIATLITKRDELMASIDAETEQRRELEKARQDFTARLEGVQEQITDIETETRALGLATQAGEKYRMEQELINAATKDFNTLTEDQIAQIQGIAEKYAAASAELKGVQEQQALAEEQAQRMADAQQRFQETLASGLTDALLGAKSAGDAFNALALEIAKAVIQAEILAMIQQGMGKPSSKSGGGGSAILGAFASIAGMFDGGTTAAAAATPSGSGAGFLSTVQASRMHTGGTVGQASNSVSMPASSFINAPRFHDGLRADEFPAILQNGEEVVPKDKVGARGGVTNINNWNITTPDPNAFRESQRQINRKIAARAQTR